MLKEQAARWYLNGYNCAECIIHAANEQWQLGMSEADMRMVSGFGGGMQCGDVCGALSAAICVISRMAVGRICAMPTVSCPPAIPIVVSGEKITSAAVRLMQKYHVMQAAVLRKTI